MPLQSDVYSQLSALKTHDDAAKLFSLLNYEYTAQTVSLKRFPSSLDGRINTLQILAGHDDFKIFHCEVDQLILGVERPIIDNLLKDHPNSLFLFSDSSKNAWHFINVKYDEEESRRKLFRRIVVGPDERLHTAAERIAMLEVSHERLSPLELQQRHDQAFDVEAVTKEFFKSFVEMFHLLREEIEDLNPGKREKASEYSQVLLDRLMFLYFVQKEGWLDGNKNFLYQHFKQGFKDQPEKHGYYSEIILRVFQKLAFSEPMYKDLGTIPFLNGGLFELEAWDMSLKIRNKVFTRMFKELFEHYNFTVREDTSLDMEVAIDPEMLGKVFENLILQLEKDPKTDLRKSTGSYYTPRVIVHFMCQQSLKEYLVEHSISPSADEKEKRMMREKIERLFALNPAAQLTEEETAWLKTAFTKEEAERLRSLILSCRVCDPAVGSGAFVVGMLHEMVAIIKLLDVLLKGQSAIRERNYDYELKRKIIERCLYGVDIQEQAVRICELRLWLSLVVDYEGSDIPPLPNLSYRIRQGNSLIDKLFGYPVNLNIPTTTEKGEKLKQLIDSIQNDKHAYFYESDLEKKRKKELGILAKQCDLASMYLKIRQDMVVAEYETKYSKGFFGNRKLKRAEEEEKQTMEQETKELERLLLLGKNTKEKLLAVEKGKLRETEKTRRLQETFVWKIDFAEVFKEKGGFDVSIGNPPYLASYSRESVQMSVEDKEYFARFYSTTSGRINTFVLFLERTLGLSNVSGFMTFIIPKPYLMMTAYQASRRYIVKRKLIGIAMCGEGIFLEANVASTIVMVSNQIAGEDSRTQLYKLERTNNFAETNAILKSQILADSEARINVEVDSKASNLLKKISEVGLPLENFAKVEDGINPGPFRDKLVLGEKINNKCMPLIEGKDFSRYSPIRWRKLYVLWDRDYLKKIQPTHPNSIAVLGDQVRFLCEEKIVTRQTAAGIIATLDKNKYHSTNSVHTTRLLDAAKPHLIEYFIAILNSKLMSYYYGLSFKEKENSFPQVKVNKLRRLPIRPIDFSKKHERELHESIVHLVNELLDANLKLSQNKSVNRTPKDIESEIDKNVFELYRLTENEASMIEQFFNMSAQL